jgi:hypothetical protein
MTSTSALQGAEVLFLERAGRSLMAVNKPIGDNARKGAVKKEPS